MVLSKCFSSNYCNAMVDNGVFSNGALFLSVNELFDFRCSAEQTRRDRRRPVGLPGELRPARDT